MGAAGDGQESCQATLIQIGFVGLTTALPPAALRDRGAEPAARGRRPCQVMVRSRTRPPRETRLPVTCKWGMATHKDAMSHTQRGNSRPRMTSAIPRGSGTRSSRNGRNDTQHMAVIELQCYARIPHPARQQTAAMARQEGRIPDRQAGGQLFLPGTLGQRWEPAVKPPSRPAACCLSRPTRPHAAAAAPTSPLTTSRFSRTRHQTILLLRYDFVSVAFWKEETVVQRPGEMEA